MMKNAVEIGENALNHLKKMGALFVFFVEFKIKFDCYENKEKGHTT